MDRTWRDGKEGALAILNDPTLSRWQKLIHGGYSYQTITANMINNFEQNQVKLKFIEDLLERKNEFKSEDDKLLLKRTEMALIRKYNSYRVPFMAISMTVCLLAAFNSNRGLVFRFFPTIALMPFISLYNHHIGQYGVHKEIDSILDLMADENLQKAESHNAEEVCEVRRLARQFI